MLTGSAAATAQTRAVPDYFLTNASERFLTDKTIDSLLYAAAADVFEFNKIPVTVLDNNYDSIHAGIVTAAFPRITRDFKNIESQNQAVLKKPPGSKWYESIRSQYIKVIHREVEHVFRSEKALKKFLRFNNSDRITGFDSRVVVLADGKLRVEETISIYNGDGQHNYSDESDTGKVNDEIKRGIVRRFPLAYTGDYQLQYNTTFDVISVQRLGEPNEKWMTKKQENGEALYIGDENTYLKNGFYTYRIVYETDHQLKRLEDMDELYWNVTGNGWSFAIESASCTVVLPTGASVLSNACYTGVQGSTARDCRSELQVKGDSIYIHFKTSKPLKPEEGFTIATSVKKGMVAEESLFSWVWWMFKGNQAVFLLPLLALLMIIYNTIMWYRVGRDPKQGNIFPAFYPPENMSPAAVGFVYNQEFDNRLLAATITDWAVRNYIGINVVKEGLVFKNNAYHLVSPTGKKVPCSYTDYADDAEGLIGSSIQKGAYNSRLGSIKTSLQKDLETRYQGSKQHSMKGLFRLNNWFLAPGNLLTGLASAYLLFAVLTRPGMSVPWHIAYMIGGILLCIGVQFFYYRIITAYTREGRKVMDQIEGFRMFLVAADEIRINAMNPPEKNIQLYEKYLPFAIALNCELEWGKQFEKMIDSASVNPEVARSMNSGFHRNFSQSFSSSLSSTISSASTPPSSSSGGGGSFGGGSSGGGGGGGGGGGW